MLSSKTLGLSFYYTNGHYLISIPWLFMYSNVVENELFALMCDADRTFSLAITTGWWSLCINIRWLPRIRWDINILDLVLGATYDEDTVVSGVDITTSDGCYYVESVLQVRMRPRWFRVIATQSGYRVYDVNDGVRTICMASHVIRAPSPIMAIDKYRGLKDLVNDFKTEIDDLRK